MLGASARSGLSNLRDGRLETREFEKGGEQSEKDMGIARKGSERTATVRREAKFASRYKGEPRALQRQQSIQRISENLN